jgi:hypothetical protein
MKSYRRGRYKAAIFWTVAQDKSKCSAPDSRRDTLVSIAEEAERIPEPIGYKGEEKYSFPSQDSTANFL